VCAKPSRPSCADASDPAPSGIIGRVPAFLPPETSEIAPRVAARNARRARRVIDRLIPLASGWRQDALRALAAVLDDLPANERAGFLFGPDLRAWLVAAEEALLLADPRTRERRLFERVARGPHLAQVAPRGRLDAGFRRRAASLGRRLRERAFHRLPPLLAFLTPADDRFGPFPLDLEMDAEEARAAGELHLEYPTPFTLRLAPGARLELARRGIRLLGRGPAPGWATRRTIGGMRLVLARRVVSTRRGLRTGPSLGAREERRLDRALALIGAVWEEGLREVTAHTRVVVPLVEAGTVSYSLPDRPGVSYINLEGKTPVDLADDLIHETAHHRLHSLEEVTRLHRDDGEPRYWSPWRRSLRPLHGVLHATYTFAWRAQLLARLLDAPGRLPRARIRRELAFEIGALGRALADLADAEGRGLLTPEGSHLRRAIAARLSALRAHGVEAPSRRGS